MPKASLIVTGTPVAIAASAVSLDNAITASAQIVGPLSITVAASSFTDFSGIASVILQVLVQLIIASRAAFDTLIAALGVVKTANPTLIFNLSYQETATV